ncbi:MAG: TrkH family potassium uptake protein [Betaproteobacteria bacterium]|nr:MAG: TrkH family potassium uptake protein [Betaproteobacteria bacterium]
MLPVAHVLGVLLMAFAVTYLLPIATALVYGDGTAVDFVLAMLIDFAAGYVLWISTRRQRQDLRPRDGYLLVTLAWIVMCAAGSIPLLIAVPQLSFTDAVFETMSGLTTTGATVMVGLDYLPPAINLWRHALQWYGGMGVVVLAIAILPLLGVGGMQLYKAEVQGAYKDKLTPRITDTAKTLWLVYAGITLAAVVALRLAGMNWFDAVNHAFTTMSTGGFSTHDASIAYFDSPAIEAVLIFFMMVAAMNFATHFAALRQLSPRVYLGDAEAKGVVVVLVASSLAVALYLWLSGVYPNYLTALRRASFNLVSVATTTGYATVDYNKWPAFAVFWMLFLTCITGSTGSTGNGIKMFRTLMLIQQAGRELKRLIHPQLISPLRFGAHVVPNSIVYAILAFIFVYFMTVVAITFLLMLSGLQFVTAFGATIAWLTNTGPGLNEVGPAANYSGLTSVQKWLGVFTMLAGRLELFTVFVLFTPTFWRK